jgi:hypothetical protein
LDRFRGIGIASRPLGRKRHPIFARIEHDTPMSHTKTHRALPASKDARRKKDAF